MAIDWNTMPLGEVVNFQRGFDLPAHARKFGAIPIVSSAGITGYHNESMVSAPGVVTGRYGTIGELFFIEEPFWPLNTTLYIREFFGNDARYIYYLLQRFDFNSFSGKSGVPGVNRNDLHSELVSLPACVTEQRVIATALSDMDALLDGLDRLIAKKCAIKQAAMQQLLTGQTRLPGFSGEWAMKRLGDHLTFLKNGVNSRAELSYSDDVRYLHYGDIHGSSQVILDPASVKMPCLPRVKAKHLDRLQNGDLIFADASEDMDGIGKSIEIQNAMDVELVSGLHTIAIRFDKSVLEDGFKAYIQFIPEFRTHLWQLAAGTKVYATNRTHIASAELRLPGVDEQQAISGMIADMETEITALETRRTKTYSLKLAMMQELLTGRTRLV